MVVDLVEKIAIVAGAAAAALLLAQFVSFS
jgi:hypothetical protein